MFCGCCRFFRSFFQEYPIEISNQACRCLVSKDHDAAKKYFDKLCHQLLSSDIIEHTSIFTAEDENSLRELITPGKMKDSEVPALERLILLWNLSQWKGFAERGKFIFYIKRPYGLNKQLVDLKIIDRKTRRNGEGSIIDSKNAEVLFSEKDGVKIKDISCFLPSPYVSRIVVIPDRLWAQEEERQYSLRP